MLRRHLLKGIAAAAIVSQAGLWSPVLASAARAASRVRPGDPGWPSRASWQKLKDTVGGNLIEVPQVFAACQSDPAAVACRDVKFNARNPFYLGDQPAGTQVSGWLDAWTPAPSAYAVKARNAADVAAAVDFARENNLRLVVKGAGHSYQGTSNAPDSLLVWTRAMSAVTLHDSFVPTGCEGKVTAVPAVTAESGAMWIDLYNAVTTEGGRYVQGGGCTDVGVAGLVQSGGFGSFSKGFGTAAAGLLEAEIVTADGKTRIVNACNEPELFWALKGGGGGSWGVVTKVTLRTHELPEFFGYVSGTIKAQSDDAYRKLIARILDFYADNLLTPHWGEQISFTPQNVLKLSMVCQGLDNSQVQGIWQPFFDWVKAMPKDFAIAEPLNAGAVPSRHWWDVAGNPSMIPDARPGVPNYHGWWMGDQGQVGAYLYGYESLWLPAALLMPGSRQHLADALFASSRSKPVSLHTNKGLAGASDESLAAVRDTATNPAVMGAFALAIIADGDVPELGVTPPRIDMDKAHKSAHAIDMAAAELRKIAPDSGSYVSESNYFNSQWQSAFWGENYARLSAAKEKYDPQGLFFVHHGVGSETWSADGFTRVTV